MDKSVKSMYSPADDQRLADYQGINEEDALQIAIMNSKLDQNSPDTSNSSSDTESEPYKGTHNSEEVANEGNDSDAAVTSTGYDGYVDDDESLKIAKMNSLFDQGSPDTIISSSDTGNEPFQEAHNSGEVANERNGSDAAMTSTDYDVDIDDDDAIKIATMNSLSDMRVTDDRNGSSSLNSEQFDDKHGSMEHTHESSDFKSAKSDIGDDWNATNHNNSDIFPEPYDDDKFEDERGLEFTVKSESDYRAEVVETAQPVEHDNTAVSFINETPPEVMRELLDKYFSHPCEDCNSEDVNTENDRVWFCNHCPKWWGYDDATDIADIVAKMVKIQPCRNCKITDIYKIRIEKVDENLEFWCLECGAAYKLNSEGCGKKGYASCSAMTGEINGKFSEPGKGESRRCLSASGALHDMGYQPQTESFGSSGRGGYAGRGRGGGEMRRRGSVGPACDQKDEVRRHWNAVAGVVSGSAQRLFKDGIKILEQASSTNTNPKNGLAQLAVREATGICNPVCIAIGSIAGTLLFKSPAGATIGGTVGQIVGQALSSFIEEVIGGKARGRKQ